MKEKKQVGDRMPGPGISYILPDKSWVNIPLDADGETVRKAQATFWLEWAKYHHARLTSRNNKKNKHIQSK